MTKKILLVLALFLAIPFASFAQGKFGVVNVQKVLEAYPAYTQMLTDLQASAKKYDDEFKKLQGEFQAKMQEFDALDASTPEGIKARRQEELQTLYERLQGYQVTAQQDLDRQQQTLMAPIQQRLVESINAVGDEGGYVFIFESTSPAYTGRSVEDVTDRVIAKVNGK